MKTPPPLQVPLSQWFQKDDRIALPLFCVNGKWYRWNDDTKSYDEYDSICWDENENDENDGNDISQ